MFLSDDFSGETDHIRISVNMREGKGDVAWQHTQLFRTALEAEDFTGLDIDIALEEKK